MRRWWVLPALVCAAMPSSAGAQTFEIFGRDRSRSRYESAQNFLVELRLGPWTPDIDAEFGGRSTPYADMFGTDARWLPSAEFDWQALRINPVGSLGLAFGAGYTSASAVSPITQSPMPPVATWNRPTDGSTTSLSVIPAYAALVFRLDVLARRTVVPIVPSVKYGVGGADWWINNGDALARRSLALSPGARASDTDLGQAATGFTFGTHFAAGVMLRLDVFEPRVQRSWDLSMGVNHSYLFAEYTHAMLDGIGSRPQLRLGYETWTVGLAMEF